MKKNLVILGGVILLVGLGTYWFVTTKNTTSNSSQEVSRPSSLEVPAGSVVYKITPATAQATYEIDELLRGKPTRVKGVTNQVTGELSVNPNNPQSLTIGTVSIDASTFVTDIAGRDENVRKLVLKSTLAENRYITFRPTQITGLSGTATTSSVPVTITGDMTILGVTKPVTFKGTVTLAGEALALHATATVAYGDFGVTIPDFSFISDVSPTTLLTIDFLAKP